MLGDDGNEAVAATPLGPVTPPGAPLRIEMDLLFDADGRLSGSVWSGPAAPQQVLGWLELMSEVTRLLTERDPGPSGPATNEATTEESR